MRAFRSSLISLAALIAFSQPAPAQDVPAREAPPQLTIVEGDVMLEREDGIRPATPGTPLFEGDRVVTSRGRAEVLFPDGTVLDMDEGSRVESVAPAYLRDLQSGSMTADGAPEVIGDRGAAVTWDGRRLPGV